MSESLRERIAEAAHDGIEAYLADRIDGYAPKPFAAAFPADRDVRFAQADAILALPEMHGILRALAAEREAWQVDLTISAIRAEERNQFGRKAS